MGKVFKVTLCYIMGVRRRGLCCLNFPALNIREAHERPEGMEETAVIMTGLEVNRILQALAVLESQPCGQQRTLPIAADYNVPNVSEKVLRIIISYTDYVNRTVWYK